MYEKYYTHEWHAQTSTLEYALLFPGRQNLASSRHGANNSPGSAPCHPIGPCDSNSGSKGRLISASVEGLRN